MRWSRPLRRLALPVNSSCRRKNFGDILLGRRTLGPRAREESASVGPERPTMREKRRHRSRRSPNPPPHPLLETAIQGLPRSKRMRLEGHTEQPGGPPDEEGALRTLRTLEPPLAMVSEGDLDLFHPQEGQEGEE